MQAVHGRSVTVKPQAGTVLWAVLALLLVAFAGVWLLLARDTSPFDRSATFPAARSEEGSAPPAVPMAERVPLDRGADPGAAPPWWYVDPVRAAEVLAFWQEAMSAAAAEVFGWRNDPAMDSGEKSLVASIARFRREDGRRYRTCERADFAGLYYDTAGEAHRSLEFQRESWGEWHGPAEGSSTPLRSLPLRDMHERPLEFPVEMHCFEYLGSMDLPDDPVLDQLLNEARNRAMRDYCAVGGDIFIMQKAMSQCIQRAGIERLGGTFPGADAFRELIPAYREAEEDRARIARGYADEIRWLLQVHGYHQAGESGG